MPAALSLYMVEDSELVQKRLGGVLTELAGVDVVGWASTAREALVGIESLKPELVTIDLGLRSGTGFDVMKALQNLPPAERPLYVVVSNHNHATHREAAIRLGAAAVFDKAHDVNALVEFILQVRHDPVSKRLSGGPSHEHERPAGSLPPDD